MNFGHRTKIIKITKENLPQNHNGDIFSVAEHSYEYFGDHQEIARKLKDKDPYTITIIIDSLSHKFWNNKKYVKKTKETISPLFNELLFKYFFAEFGQRGGNELYARWLEKYRSKFADNPVGEELDNYITKVELESRYKEAILKKFKNQKKLFLPRTEIIRERFYNLPYPMNRVDWRNPYDNIFVWEEKGKKYFSRGGSGSSGGRETNSKFIFGYSLINKIKPVKTYLFLYANNNQLYFIKKFSSLTIPDYDIGSNYFLKKDEEENILSGVNFLEWKDWSKLKEIRVSFKSRFFS